MVQMSSFYIDSLKSKMIQDQLKQHFHSLVLEGNCLKSSVDQDLDWSIHQRIFRDLYASLMNEKSDFISKNEYYSDDREYHEHIVYKDGYMQRTITSEEYGVEDNKTTYFFKKDKSEEEQYDQDSWELDEDLCLECGEYIKKHGGFPFSYCPYCGHVENITQNVEEIVVAKWKDYDFEIPLGIEFPEQIVSSGQDWIGDCEQDDIFGLNPACFHSENQYIAALRLCRICAGWYRFDTQEEKENQIECIRRVVLANKGEPMWYYDVWQNSFDWLAALRENNPKYFGKLLQVTDLWDLFNRLQQRSIIEKAECFDWFIGFFGDCLKYENRYKLSDVYVQNYYDSHMENILYLYPHQIDILTKSVARISSHSCSNLARTAAGLIRMGKRDLGLSMYKKLFAMVWSDQKSTVDEKKNVMDYFIERLAMGYENEPYIDDEIATLLDKQCNKYSDGAWSSKIRMNLGKGCS